MDVEFFLLVISLLFFASIFFDRIGQRFGMPALLIFLLVGILFGQEGLGIRFDNTESAQAIATIAMCVILFTGGLDTKLETIRPVIGAGVTLATFGVLITCLITGLVLWVASIPFDSKITLPMALLVAATLSSTDSASVFSILRGRGIRLKHRLGPTLELESGANDPMAYVLVTTLIGICTNQGDTTVLGVVQSMVIQLVVGFAIGIASGYILIWVLKRVKLTNMSLYPIMILSACILIFSMTYYMRGNSYLAVYVGGLIIGNYKFARKRQTRSFFDGLNWLCQLMMFLMLGLMVTPSDFLRLSVWIPALAISVLLITLARPIAVFLSMLPFSSKYNGRDMIMVSWVGLKGAVPIIFAIQCKAHGVQNADFIFDLIFLCSLISLTFQGLTIERMARYLKLAIPASKLKHLYHFDLDLPEEIESSVTELTVDAAMMEHGAQLKDLHLPRKTLVIMVNRAENYFVPTGVSELQVGDNLLVITDDDAALAQQQMEQEHAAALNDWQHKLIQHPTEFIRAKADEFMNHETQ